MRSICIYFLSLLTNILNNICTLISKCWVVRVIVVMFLNLSLCQGAECNLLLLFLFAVERHRGSEESGEQVEHVPKGPFGLLCPGTRRTPDPLQPAAWVTHLKHTCAETHTWLTLRPERAPQTSGAVLSAQCDCSFCTRFIDNRHTVLNYID